MPERVGDCIAQVLAECEVLDKTRSRETSLLIFPQGLEGFYAYLEVIDLAEAKLKSNGYEGVYQLASFHPDYLFAEVEAGDASHYTNRSPYPIIHILREASVEAAVAGYDNPEKIPERNIALTRKMGVGAMRSLLRECFRP